MSTLLLKNGRVIDPSRNFDAVADLWLADGAILGAAPSRTADKAIDCTGLIVAPGLIDMHVHLREPGREEDETIATGTAAAVAGGVTSVACMPNTEPAIDTRMAAEFVIQQAQRAGNCNVFPIGAVTKNRDGKELAELGGLVEGGAVAFTDDGAPVYSAEIMRRALEYCKMLNRAVLVHAEILELTQGGVMNEGFVSTQLGLRGMPAVAEDIMIYRDMVLAELTGGRCHILHVSTAGGVDLIRQGIARGIGISGEACPHHFLLTDETLRSFDSNFKMSPPLRTQKDVNAILAGLKDGTLSVLATDHAPHAPEKKERELDQAPNGILGLETFLPLCVTHLVEKGHLTWPQMLAKMTVNPAKVLGIDRGTLEVGRPADVTVIDPKAKWTIDKSAFKSKSRNTPFDGAKVTGRAVATIVGGAVKMNRMGEAMTEAEWFACDDPVKLLEFAGRYHSSERKLRLYAVAGCRRIWSFLPDERFRRAVEVAELFADRAVSKKVRSTCWKEMDKAQMSIELATQDQFGGHGNWPAASMAASMAIAAATNAVGPSEDFVRPEAELFYLAANPIEGMEYSQRERGIDYRLTRETEWSVHRAFLRDIFGNPFRPAAFDPSWRTTTAVQLAQGMYDSRDFAAMPILADALQDAGCENADILDHCRSAGAHVRGCWVVDLVLGKE